MNKLFISLILMTQFTHANPIYFNHYHNEIKVKSWKQIRDHNVVKQDLDFSCGAASIATLLNGYYNQKVTIKTKQTVPHGLCIYLSFSY